MYDVEVTTISIYPILSCLQMASAASSVYEKMKGFILPESDISCTAVKPCWLLNILNMARTV